MNLPDTVAFLTWLSQHDARIQVTDAEVEIWQHTLTVIPTANVKAAALEFYRISEKEKATPHTIRKLAIAERDRAAAKKSALEPPKTTIKNPLSYRQRNPELWDQLVTKGAADRRANLIRRGRIAA